MHTAEEKKILFVLGNEQKPDRFLEKLSGIQRENIIIIQSYGSTIAPFGDIMRDMILVVHLENVDEIFVAAATNGQHRTSEIEKIIFENKELQQKIQTLDYLFKNCMPEFPNVTLREWFSASHTHPDVVQHSINFIRQHPLIPAHIKVSELSLNEDQLC